MSGNQMILLGGSQAPVVDPYFYSVTSLLHGDGTNGGQNNTFLDSSTNNFTITRNGNTTQGSFSPFSQTGWSGYFNGSSDYISVADSADFTMGSGDFTIQCWVYSTSNSGSDQYILGQVNSGGTAAATSFQLYKKATSNVAEAFVYAGSSKVATGTAQIPVGQWTHLAMVRDGGTLRLYVNGSQDGTNATLSTTAITDSAGSFSVGRTGDYNGLYFAGYVSNVSVVKGTCLFPSGTTFTPSTTPLSTSTSGQSVLLCQANRFIDTNTATTAKTVTVGSTSSIQPFSPFNPTTPYSTSAVGGSGYFDGSGDYLSLADNAAFDVGSGNFTFEFWMYTSVTGSDMYIFGQSNSMGSTATVSYYLYKTSGNKLTLGITNGVSLYAATSTNNLPVNAWVHIACVRDGNTLRNYINGVQDGTADVTGVTAVNSSTQLAIGRLGEYNASLYSGYISNFRMVVGTCVYTGGTSFTPPTAPLPAIANTQLLTNFTNGAIFDNAAVADYETVGNAQISTSVKKYGTGSMSFDGTGDWLAAPPTSQSDLGSGDFTIECWLYRTASGATFDSGIVSRGAPSTSNGFVFAYTSSNVLTFNFNYAGAIVTGTTAIPINTWTHVAVCRIGTTFKLFVNGNVDGTATSSSSQTLNASDVFYIGRSSFDSGRIVTGYIDDLRISKGVARYPYNFTPPTAELPNIGGTVTLTADPYYDYTTLLLPGNGTNGAQNNTFLDSSTNAFSITRNGNTTQGTFSPFSQTGWSNYFDGTGDYLTTNATQAIPATGDFTVDGWIWCNSYALGPSIISQGTAGTSGRTVIYITAAGKLALQITSTINEFGSAIPTNQWVYFAITRTGSTVTGYINGSSVGTATNSGSIQNTTLEIGGEWNGDPYRWIGYLSNIRVSNVVRTITAAPTAPFTSDANTVVLTCQSNRFIDASSNAYTITRNGDVSVQAFSPFNPTAAWSAATNGGSGYFDGSGDYLSVTNSNDFDTNTTFTLECWIYQPAAGTGTFFSRGGGNSSNYWSTSDGYQFILYISGGTLYWQWNNAGSATSISGTAPAAGAWHHVVVGYNGTTTRLWLDGASVGTSTTAYTLPTTRNRVYIGAETAVATNLMNGYIAGLRFVQGTDVYGVGNTSISVPTAPPTAVTNTKFLANFTNAGIYDATSKNDLETVGNAQISTAQSKFGGSSMYFDGTDDSLRFYEIINTQFGTGDFTVECWVYISSLASNQVICDARGSTVGTQPWQFYVNTSGKVVFNYGSNLVGGISVSTATWTHIAAARYGSTLRIFVNGVFDSSATTSASLNGVSGQPAYIGRVYDSPGSPYFNGYIDDLRITKGIARYTSNFTPPTTAFLTL